MKTVFIICLILFVLKVHSQQADSGILKNVPINLVTKPEVLSEGSIDIIQTGQMNAAARIFRLYIGEPGKFQLPLSLYAGVSSNNLSSFRQYEEFVPNLINPGSGILNFYFDGNNRLSKSRTALTSFHFQYQAGFRMLNAYFKAQQKNIQLFNIISTAGFSFMTGAWERNKIKNMGLFWLSIRGIYSMTPGTLLQELMAEKIKTGMLGFSMGIGIEISQALNMKIYYFRFITNKTVTAFDIPYLQLSLKYSMK